MITAERLREILRYDQETGEWTRIFSRNFRHPIGSKVGASHCGYVRIGIDGKSYLSHRLAWFYMTGAWPKDEIDHVNMDKSDNRWCNLRSATHGQNQQNQKGWGVSGLKGVYWRRDEQKWIARIGPCGETFLGYHSTKEAAQAAYAGAAIAMYGEYARIG